MPNIKNPADAKIKGNADALMAYFGSILIKYNADIKEITKAKHINEITIELNILKYSRILI